MWKKWSPCPFIILSRLVLSAILILTGSAIHLSWCEVHCSWLMTSVVVIKVFLELETRSSAKSVMKTAIVAVVPVFELLDRLVIIFWLVRLSRSSDRGSHCTD